MRIGWLVVFAGLAGCSGAVAPSEGEPATKVTTGAMAIGACNHPDGYCLARVGGGGMAPAECTQLGGTPVAACPAAEVVGVCRMSMATPEPWDRYAYASCAGSPEEACEAQHGTWRAVP